MKYILAIFLILSAIGCSDPILPATPNFTYTPAPTGPPTNFNFYWSADDGATWSGYVVIEATCVIRDITVVTDGSVYTLHTEAGNIFNAGDILTGKTIGQVFRVSKNGVNYFPSFDIGTEPGEVATIGIHIVYVTP